MIVYVVAGYPILVRWRAKAQTRAVQKARMEPTVTAIVAVHNGGHYLRAKLDSLLALDYPRDKFDIMVVSDGSTDDTEAIAQSYTPHQRVKLLRIPKGGKCAALNAAIPTATGEILLLTDVRQVVEPASLRYLVENFADAQVGAVSGELIIQRGSGGAEADIGAYWRFETWLRDTLAGMDSMIGATGPFYCLRRSLAVPVPPDTLLDDMYLPLKGAFFTGHRLAMERRARAYDPPMPLATEFRRKVRTLAGNWQLLQLLPELLSRQNRMLWHYASYKLGRLLLPWLMAAFFLLSLVTPWPWNALLAGPQVLFYAAGVLARYLPDATPGKRHLSPVVTFLTMMWASVLAIQVFFVRPADLWSVTSARPKS
ncbi:MAG: glycosyltransferase [Bryobacteraceae bacterium]